MKDEQMEEIQSRNNAIIEEYEREVLGLKKDTEIEKDGKEWNDLQAKVQEVIDRDEAEENEGAETGDAATELNKEVEVAKGLFPAEDLKEKNLSANSETGSPGPEAVARTAESEALVVEQESYSGEDVEPPMQTERRNDTSNGLDETLKEDSATLTDAKSTGDAVIHTEHKPRDTPESRATTSHPTQSYEEVIEDKGVPISEALKRTPQESILASDPDVVPADSSSPPLADSGTPLLAMVLTLRNKVNGQYVKRPIDFNQNKRWEVEYTLDEITDPQRAKRLYKMCQTRRRKAFEPEDSENRAANWYLRKMADLSAQGAAWRNRVDQKAKSHDVVVLDPNDENEDGSATVTEEEDEEEENEMEEGEDEEEGKEDEEDDENEDEDGDEEDEEEEEDDEDEEDEDEEEDEEEEEDEQENEGQEDDEPEADGEQEEKSGKKDKDD